MFYLRQRDILVNLILITVIWVSVTFNYYMINFQVKYFPGSFDVNTIAMFGSDIPFCLLAGFLISILQTRTVFMIFHTIQIFASLTVLAFIDPDNPGLAFPFLIALARGGVIATFVTVWVAHPKMFPTLFAVTSMGISNIFSRSIVILAPMIAEVAFPTPIIIFAVLNIISCISSWFIKTADVQEEGSESTKN